MFEHHIPDDREASSFGFAFQNQDEAGEAGERQDRQRH
jgi:hypothetical protein